MRFVLASASPARLRTLRHAGLDPEVVVSGVDESLISAGSTPELVQALADAKAAEVARRLSGAGLVLGCDSMLDLDGVALGKPADADEAIARWQQMRGKSGTLYTGHRLIDLADGRAVAGTVSTQVHFADADDDEIARYVATGEPAAVAGAFTIDGLGGWFIRAVEGDHHNVVGISLPTVRELIRELGVTLDQLGWPRADQR